MPVHLPDEEMSRASGEHINVDSTRSDRRVANGDDEDKDSVPEDTKAIIERADELFEQKEHARTREYLNNELQKCPASVEMVRLLFA